MRLFFLCLSMGCFTMACSKTDKQSPTGKREGEPITHTNKETVAATSNLRRRFDGSSVLRHDFSFQISELPINDFDRILASELLYDHPGIREQVIPTATKKAKVSTKQPAPNFQNLETELLAIRGFVPYKAGSSFVR